jgi:putative membrane protein
MPASKKSFLGLLARGLGMGAADVVPGVSGGTIAFITGIYEEFLETISNLKFSLIITCRKQGFKAMWNKLNGSFLLAVFLGIGISVVSLSKLLKYLLEHHEVLLWSFFFGLIIASVWLVGKTVGKWNASTIIGLILGAGIAFYITIITPTSANENLFYIFVCGALAICAMILPGISGSFILLLLGVYATILGTISDLIDTLRLGDWAAFKDHAILMTIFIIGCLFGLITFSKLLNYLFKKNKPLIIAVLTGFLIGSLNKIWPWKETLETTTNRKGEIIPLVQKNILPNHFTEITHESNHLIVAIILMITGFAIIFILDKFGRQKPKKSND